MNPILNPRRRHRRLLERVSPESDEYILLIDNSTFELETTCSRQMEYGAIMGRTRGGNAALTYGGAMHTALELDLLGHDYITCTNAINRAFEDVMMHFSHDEWRTPEHCIEGFRQYLNYYETARFKPIEFNGAPMVEYGFRIPLFTLDIDTHLSYPKSLIVKDEEDYETPAFYVSRLHVIWTGKIDLIAERFDGIFCVDHKTTSMVGPSFWNDFMLSSQMQGYAWAGRKLGIPVKGVIVDAIVGRKPTKTGIAHEFGRQTFEYSDDQLHEWEKNTSSIISTMVGRLVDGFFPMQTKWCMGKYGACKFHDVCIQPAHVKLNMLMSPLYEDNSWSPLDSHLKGIGVPEVRQPKPPVEVQRLDLPNSPDIEIELN